MLSDSNSGEVYILVDALDECEKPSQQAFLTLLARLFTLDRNVYAKFLITYRPELEIVQTLFAVGRYLRIDLGNINTDLSRFIDIRVDELSRDKGYPNKLAQDIKHALRDYVGGTFLWASLVLDDIFKTKMASKVRGKLEALPSSLGDVYSRILGNIDDECVNDAVFILQCVVVARRPLTVSELAMARALGPEGWNKTTIPPADTLNELRDGFKCCEPLLYLDPDHETINLIHQSAKDYHGIAFP